MSKADASHIKFTNAGLKALKPKESRYIKWEKNGKGLGLRVSPAGRKTFVFMYRFHNKPRMMTLGHYQEDGYGKGLSLADAHTKHGEAMKLLEQEIDPGQKTVEKNVATRKAPTVNDLCDEYLEKWAKPRKRSWKEDERILEKDVKPALGRIKAKDVKRRDIIKLLDEIKDRGAPIQANRTLACVRKMFKFAVRRDILDTSPCLEIEAPAVENQRDRILDEKEIKTVWNNLSNTNMSGSTPLALKLMLLTAQRKGEVVSSEWPEFDLENGWWTIPENKAKNGLSHRVPLSPQALQILEDIKKINESATKEGIEASKYLFPSKIGDKPIAPNSVDRAIRNNAEILKVDHFTPHDLRRTAASLMTSMGISRLTVSKILNHKESGITAVYDRHSYDKEKQQALDTLGRKVNGIISNTKDDNVVGINRA